MKLKDIRPNPSNPRIIRDARFEKLKRSIQEFPKMMKLRPIVVDNTGMILGGNMRLRALQDLGFKEVPDEWVRQADELTEEEKQRFIIADNVGFVTFIQTIQGRISNSLLFRLGFTKSMIQKCPSLFMKNGTDKFLSYLASHGVEKVHIFSHNRKNYLGFYLY